MRNWTQSIGLLVAVCWLGALVWMGVSGLSEQDGRWSWGVGEDVVDYEVAYVWLIDETKYETYVVPANELSSNAVDYLSPGEPHQIVSGIGTLRSMIEEYVQYIATKQTIYRPRISLGAGALVTYQLNGEELERRFTFEYISDEN